MYFISLGRLGFDSTCSLLAILRGHCSHGDAKEADSLETLNFDPINESLELMKEGELDVWSLLGF